jgi:hypothetical protein
MKLLKATYKIIVKEIMTYIILIMTLKRVLSGKNKYMKLKNEE